MKLKIQKLLKQSNGEMREQILNAIINQVRYPNLITHYFINFILHLFLLDNDMEIAAIQDLITRILLERLMIMRPYPWGLMFIFIELIRDQKYNFKSKQSFQHTKFEGIMNHVFSTLYTPQAQNQGEEAPGNNNNEVAQQIT